MIGDSQAPPGAPRWTRFHTAFLLPWLLHKLYSSCVSTTKDTALYRQRVNAALNAWLSVMAASERQPGVDTPFGINFGNGRSVTVNFAANKTVTGLHELRSADPDLDAAWAQLQKQYGRLFSYATAMSQSTWLTFLFFWLRGVRRPSAPVWIAQHLREGLSHVAVEVQSWVIGKTLQKDFNSLDPESALMEIRTSKGRRQALDPLYHLHLETLRQRLSGSGQTMAEVLAGRNTNAARTRVHVMNKIMIEGVKQHFGSLRTFSINFDPGSYSGHSVNIALLYSPDIQLAAEMAPRVAKTGRAQIPCSECPEDTLRSDT